MPPETEEIPRPATRGKDACDYLEAHGLVAHVPSLRSSDYETVLRDPFSYYLHRRLGLSDPLRWSKALSRGSWFHTRLQHLDRTPEEADHLMGEALFARLEELKQTCATFGVQPEKAQEIYEREEQDFQVSRAWYETVMEYPLPNGGLCLSKFVRQPWFRLLGTELLCRWTNHWWKKTPIVAQYDILLYHEAQNSIWIVDPKTCTEPTHIRLASCPIEFQTQHYMMVLHNLIKDQVIQKHFDLPMDVKVGGMIHWAVQKPTIEFGMLDRDFSEEEHTITRGERKGTVEVRRSYRGDPRYSNYVERCLRWYYGQGEYEHRQAVLADNPPVNTSTISGSAVHDLDFRQEWTDRLDLIHKYATCHPHPDLFLRSARSVQYFGKLSGMAPFYLSPVADWPTIVQDLHLIKTWRDEEIEWGDQDILSLS